MSRHFTAVGSLTATGIRVNGKGNGKMLVVFCK